MAVITKAEFKAHANVIHDDDDGKIDLIIDACNAWAEKYLGVNIDDVSSSSSSETVDANVKLGMLLLAQKHYDGEIKDFDALQKAAECMFFPSRTNLGF